MWHILYILILKEFKKKTDLYSFFITIQALLLYDHLVLREKKFYVCIYFYLKMKETLLP